MEDIITTESILSIRKSTQDVMDLLLKLEGGVNTENTEAVLEGSGQLLRKGSDLYSKISSTIAIRIAGKPIQKNELNNLFKLVTVCSGFEKTTLLKQYKYRGREIVVARQVHMAILHLAFGLSLKSAGSLYYNKDHATVLHGIKTINCLLDTDDRFKQQYKPVFVYALDLNRLNMQRLNLDFAE